MSETAGIESSLFSKVGPLPAWLWAVIVVGAYLGYEHLSSRNASPATDTGETDTTGDSTDSGDTGDGTDTYDVGSGDGSGGTSYGGGEYTGSSGVSPVANYATNQQWLIGAIDQLRVQGYPAGPVTTALTYYIRGHTLTATDAKYVNAAIQAIGPPPEPLPLKTGTTPSTQPTPTAGATVPGAPTVKLVRKTKTSITIGWNSVPNAVNYQVVAGTQVHMQSGRTYTLSGLHSGTEHKFYVRARNKKGQLGPESNHLSVTTK